MDTAQLLTFTTVVRHGTFSAAAQELALSQSGVSRQILKLEHEIGVDLFDRSVLPIALTAAGEQFRAYAEQVLAQHEELIRSLHGQTLVVSGELRIVASTTPGEFLVPQLVSAFSARYPHVTTSVRIQDSAEALSLLREDAYDLGFVGAREESPDLTYEEIAQDEIVVAMPARHQFARRRSVRLEDLNGQPFVLREEGSGTLRSVVQALEAMGHKMPAYRVVMVLSSHEAIVEAVRAGLGLGFVSTLALEGRTRQAVRALRIEGIPLVRPLYMVYSRGAMLSPVSRAFIEFTLEHRNLTQKRGSR